jgi:hypothetical protein
MQGLIDLLELVGEVTVVELRVGRLQQPADPRAQVGGQSTRRRPPAAPMDEPARALDPKPHLQALELARGQAESGRSLEVGDPAGECGLEKTSARHFFPAHRECLHGVTFSRSS